MNSTKDKDILYIRKGDHLRMPRTMKEEIRTFKFYEKLIILINNYKSTNLSIQMFICRAWNQKKVYNVHTCIRIPTDDFCSNRWRRKDEGPYLFNPPTTYLVALVHKYCIHVHCKKQCFPWGIPSATRAEGAEPNYVWRKINLFPSAWMFVPAPLCGFF